MWRKLSLCLSVVIFSVVVFAQNSQFKIQGVNDTKRSLSPGSLSNIAIKLGNNTSEEMQVFLKIENPPGWRCFSVMKTIPVPGQQSILKILSFSIPESSPAGDYSVRIEAYSKQGQKIGTMQIPVTINPRYELNVKLIHAPEYVSAGDTFPVQFVVQNLSNSRVGIETLLKGTGDNEKMNFSLMPDSSIYISRKMKAESGILKSVRKNIILTAALDSMPAVYASAHHFYMVIPSGNTRVDPYNRIPVQFSTLFVSDNSQGERLYATLYDITGSGFLDDKKTRSINFKLQGPDRRGKPLYGINDDYFVEFNSPKSRFILGDQTYKLSYLTEYSRYGRGGLAEYSFHQFTIGSFITFPRYYPGIKREVSVYAGYTPSGNNLKLNAGYLSKLNRTGDAASLITLNGKASLFSWASVDWEYAVGLLNKEYSQAVKTELRVSFKPLRLFYSYMLSEKGFPGYFTDTRYRQVNGNLRLSGKMNVSSGYSNTHQNTALDTLYSSVPYSKNLSFSFNYRISKNAGISFGYEDRNRQDRMKPMKFNYNENSMRLLLNKQIKDYRFDFLGKYGKTENLLIPRGQRLNNMYYGRLTTTYQPSNKTKISSFVSYQENNRYQDNGRKNWQYGVSANTSVRTKMNLAINYQSSYNLEEYYRNRSILDGRLSYAPDKNNRIDLSGRYSLVKNALDVKEFAWMIRYVRNLNVPVSKKKNIGKLSGRVTGRGVENLEGMVLSLGADKAVSDKKGNYRFPVLAAGTYYMMVDYSKAGVNVISGIPGPYLVDIQPGKETKFDFELTLSSRITGQIVIEKKASTDDKKYAGARDQLGKLMIEARKEGEMFRTFTNEDGTFAFENLRPGKWTVQVYDRGIPKEYELVTPLFSIDLAPGHTEQLEVKIKEKLRRIKFQKSWGSTLLPDFKQQEFSGQ